MALLQNPGRQSLEALLGCRLARCLPRTAAIGDGDSCDEGRGNGWSVGTLRRSQHPKKFEIYYEQVDELEFVGASDETQHTEVYSSGFFAGDWVTVQASPLQLEACAHMHWSAELLGRPPAPV